MNIRNILLSTLICIVMAPFALSQSNIKTDTAEKYLISARAGGVNYSKGSVNVVRTNGAGGVILKGDQINIGDRLSTGDTGKVELLLNPGSFLRLGSNSSLEFVSTELDNLRIRISSGNAILEVIATDQFKVEIDTPTGSATLVESGIYRFDVTASKSSVSVYDGKALVNGLKVKGGRSAQMNSASASAVKFDRKAADDLALWSRTRARDLAVLTSTLRNDRLRTALMGSTSQWSIFDSFGLWIYSPFGRTYCFLPFGRNWYSPYGYGYGGGMRDLNLPIPTVNPSPVREVPPEGKLDRRPPVEDVDGIVTQRPQGEVRSARPPYTAIEKRQQHGGNRGWGPVEDGGSDAFGTGGRRTEYPGDVRSSPAGIPQSPASSQPAPAPVALPRVFPGKMSPTDN